MKNIKSKVYGKVIKLNIWYNELDDFDSIIILKKDIKKVKKILSEASKEWAASNDPNTEFSMDCKYNYVFKALNENNIDYTTQYEEIDF